MLSTGFTNKTETFAWLCFRTQQPPHIVGLDLVQKQLLKPCKVVNNWEIPPFCANYRIWIATMRPRRLNWPLWSTWIVRSKSNKEVKRENQLNVIYSWFLILDLETFLLFGVATWVQVKSFMNMHYMHAYICLPRSHSAHRWSRERTESHSEPTSQSKDTIWTQC